MFGPWHPVQTKMDPKKGTQVVSNDPYSPGKGSVRFLRNTSLHDLGPGYPSTLGGPNTACRFGRVPFKRLSGGVERDQQETVAI